MRVAGCVKVVVAENVRWENAKSPKPSILHVAVVAEASTADIGVGGD